MKIDLDNERFERDLKWYVIYFKNNSGSNYCVGYYTGKYIFQGGIFYSSTTDIENLDIRIFKTKQGATRHVTKILGINIKEINIIPVYTCSLVKDDKRKYHWGISLRHSNESEELK